MIKDTITYKKNSFLTIYHQGFSNDSLTQKRVRQKRIGRFQICFTEEYAPEWEWNQMTGYAWEESALLMPKEKHNPYHEAACANMVHRIYLDKPEVIWKKDGKTLDETLLVEVFAFIRDYTGMNLENNPVYLGDAFLFSASKQRFHSNKANSVVLQKLNAGMRVVLHLKNGQSILESKTVEITEDTEELEITTACDWNQHDIEIYQDDKLVYINRDCSYIKRMHFNLTMESRKKRIPLLALRKYYELALPGSVQESVIGTPPEPVKSVLGEMNQTLIRKLTNQKSSDRFLFVQPGELNVAMDKITKMIYKATDEIWLIDSYFTDKNHGLQQMTDWLRLLVNAGAAEKNIVFYSKGDEIALNAAELKIHSENDIIIQDAMAIRNSLAIQLIQTKQPIHDRFLIVRNQDSWSGLSIGTSFNSLNSNHYCIQKLLHREAQEVLMVLCNWMEGNTVAREVLTYDNK